MKVKSNTILGGNMLRDRSYLIIVTAFFFVSIGAMEESKWEKGESRPQSPRAAYLIETIEKTQGGFLIRRKLESTFNIDPRLLGRRVHHSWLVIGLLEGKQIEEYQKTRGEQLTKYRNRNRELMRDLDENEDSRWTSQSEYTDFINRLKK